MNLWSKACLVVLLLVGLAAPSVNADTAFDSFWARFKAAIVRGDKQAVASLTRLPYACDYKQLNKAQFIAKYAEIFPKGTAKCFVNQKPIADQGSYSAFCGEQIYVFAKVKDKWMFTEIGAND